MKKVNNSIQLFDLFNILTQQRLLKQTLNNIGAQKMSRYLNKYKMSPNIISIVSLAFGLCACFFLFKSHSLFVFFLFLHVLIDMYDGYYARATNQESNLGMYLDRLSDFTIYFAFLTKSYFYINSQLVYYVLLIMSLHTIAASIFKMLNILPTNRIFIYFYALGYFQTGLWVQAIFQTLKTLILFKTIVGKHTLNKIPQ